MPRKLTRGMLRKGKGAAMSMDMNQLLKQAQQMQAEMARLQAEAAAETVEATAGGGMVTVKANGAREVVSVTIKPEGFHVLFVFMFSLFIMFSLFPHISKNSLMSLFSKI